MAEILALARISTHRFLSKPRVYVALAVCFCVFVLCYQDVPFYLEAHQLSIQAVEPFLLIMCGSAPQLLLLLSFLLLVGDIPYLHNGAELVLIRTRKARWLMGQFLCTVWILLLWFGFMLLGTWIIFGGHISLRNDWSVFVKTISRLGISARATGLKFSISSSMTLLSGGSPYMVFAVSIGYNLLLFLFLSLWATFLNLSTGKSYSSVLVSVFYGLHMFFRNEPAFQGYLRFSPIHLANLTVRQLNAPSVLYTVSFFLVQIILMAVLSHWQLVRVDTSKLR